jgi:hypothetical protein
MAFLNTEDLLNTPELYEQILFFLFGSIALLLLVLQVVLLSKLNLLCVQLLLLLSFSIAYENFTLFANTFTSLSTEKVNACNFFHSLQIPLFFIFLFEITLRLYEARSAPFCFIPFDQGAQYVKFRMTIFLWFIRLVSIGLFIINILVNYDFIESNDTDGENIAGNGGYISLSEHSKSNVLILSLIPPILLSGMGILIMIQVYRYGIHMTWEQKKNDRWKLIIPGVLGQIIGQIFGTKVYPVTSNAGELSLLISSSILLLLIQRELALAASFADYLRRSNVAFHYFDAVKSENNIEVERHRESISMSSLGGVSKFLQRTDVENKDKELHNIEHIISSDEIELQL